jgi:hypothetical protein
MIRFFLWIRRQLTPELIPTQKGSIQIIPEIEIPTASGDLPFFSNRPPSSLISLIVLYIRNELKC